VGEWIKNGMAPHQIYEYFATGRGTDLLDDAQTATRLEWELEDGRANLIRKQGELIRGGWQGAASEGAFGAAQPLAESALHGADALSRAEDLLDRQSGSFHRAANSVKPVPTEPPKLEMNDTMLPFTDYDKDVTSYQADAQHNIDVYRGYDGASHYNQTNMPSTYSTVNHAGGNISVTASDGRPDDTGDYIDSTDYQPPRGDDDFSERRDPGSAPVSEPLPDRQQPQQTTPTDFGQPSITTPGNLPSTFQPTPTGPTPGGLVAGLPVGGFTGSGPGGGTGGPGARGGTFGGQGGPGSSGRGPGSAGPRGGVLGAGPGVGALAADEAAARRAAAAAAARGAGQGVMGGAPVGAGRGKGDEDEEHQRKFLIEIDPEGTFGSDVLTAPQVIGDDDYEDD
jgi:hypothetical protein